MVYQGFAQRESINTEEIVTILDSQDIYNVIPHTTPFSGLDSTYGDKMLGSDLYLKLDGISRYNYTGSSNLDNNKIEVGYSKDPRTIGVELVNSSNPSASYRLNLTIAPMVIIDKSKMSSLNKSIDYLSNNPDVRAYFKDQLIGSSILETNNQDYVPLVNISNNYDYRYNRANDGTMTRVLHSIGYNFFDIFYKGDSEIQRFLDVYYKRNKPLFHSYVSRYMAERSKPFNYT